MPYADLFIAAKHCQLMRDLVIVHTGGWHDDPSLRQMHDMAAAAASAVDGKECKDFAAAITHLSTDLFSASGHEKWAHGRTSGADFLRLRILREIKAFQDRPRRYRDHALSCRTARPPLGNRSSTAIGMRIPKRQ